MIKNKYTHIFFHTILEPCFASTPERRNENINVNKHFISSSGDRTHNQSILQPQFVPPRHDRPQNTKIDCIILLNIIYQYKTFNQTVSRVLTNTFLTNHKLRLQEFYDRLDIIKD